MIASVKWAAATTATVLVGTSVFAAPAALAAERTSGSHHVRTISRGDQHVRLHRHHRLRLDLYTVRDADYSWAHLGDSRTGVVKIVRKKVVAYPHGKHVVGYPYHTYYLLKAVAPGVTRLRFVERRPTDHSDIARHFHVTITVPRHHAATPTSVITVRPVRAGGGHARGYSVHRAKPTVGCSTRSAAAVDPDIDACNLSLDIAPACWQTAGTHHVLCLPDARKLRLVKYRLRGAFPATRPRKRPAPLDLRLSDGAYCRSDTSTAVAVLRDHPSYQVWFFCNHGETVWGPADRHRGVDATHGSWTVRVTRGAQDDLHKRHVRRAWLVGTL